MMRDSRRRSPDSSKKRKKEKRESRDIADNDKITTTTTTTTTRDNTASRGNTTVYKVGTRDGADRVDRPRDPSFYDVGQNADYYAETMGDFNQPPPQSMPQPMPMQMPPQQQPQGSRSRAMSDSGSSMGSTDSSLLDISRRYSGGRRRPLGGFISTFFRAPSDRRRRQRRRSGGSGKRRALYFGNSSSSSVNSDMAYGRGYIPRRKSRDFASREYSRRSATTTTTTRRDVQDGPPRSKTDEEIIALGRQLSDIARRQNDEDLRRAGRSRPSGLQSAATKFSEFRKQQKDRNARGIGSSRPHGDSSDDAEWESASEDEGSDDSHMAYGSVVSHALRPGMTAAAAGVAAGAAAGYAMGAGRNRREDEDRRRASQKGPAVVDPNLFGPVNSLHGFVHTPCGFVDDQAVPYSSRREREPRLARSSTEPAQSVAMKNVYAVPTSDPNRFDADRSSITSRQDISIRPGPAPLQQPIPRVPVSSKVYDAEKIEDAERRSKRDSRGPSDSKKSGWEDAALAAAAAGVAGAAITHYVDERNEEKKDARRESREYRDKPSERSEKRDKDSKRRDRDSERDRDRDREREKDRDRERDRERDRDRDRDRDKDKERRKSKRDSYSSKPGDVKDHKRSSRQDSIDDNPKKKRELDKVTYNREGEAIDVEYEPDARSEVSRQSRRDSRKYDSKDKQSDVSYQDRSRDKDRSQGESALSKIDPFKFQVDEFPAKGDAVAKRPLTPTVVTVERVPTFHDSPPRMIPSESRLSRKDSFEIEQWEKDHHNGSRGGSQFDPRRGHEYEEDTHAAQSIYTDVKSATVPIAAAAIASAVAVETERSRERRRDQYSDDGSRERARGYNVVQEEADRHYREGVVARQIAEQEVRSHDRNQDRSVVDKYEDDTQQAYTIVTPPGMPEKEEAELYGVPNADVRIDNQIFPKEEHRFRSTSVGANDFLFRSKDPDCEQDRPLLNLILPTPASSRQPTPSPEKQAAEASKEVTSDTYEDVVVDSKGQVTQSTTTPKSVSWGENTTDVYEVVTPEPRNEAELEKDRSEAASQKSRPRLNGSSQWGILAAAIAGSAIEPANEPDSSRDPSSKKSQTNGSKTRDIVDETEKTSARSGSPPSSMPGGFGDDIEFAATLAAGLKDTGFDPNIVIDDPNYHRRDSPPGSNDDLDGDVNRRKGTSSDTARSLPDSGFVIGEVETPKDEPAADDQEWAEVPAKLTKKEKRRLEKQAKRQSMDAETEPEEPERSSTVDDVSETPTKLSKKEQRRREKAARSQILEDEPTIVAEPEPMDAREIAAEEEWEESSKKKSKKNRKSRDMDDDVSSKVSVPVDAFDDLQRSKDADPNDEWEAAPKKSKKKSKRSSTTSTPTQSEVAWEDAQEEPSSRRSSKSSKRRSRTEDDFNEYGDDPPDPRSDPFEDRDVSSVVSESRRDERRRESRHSKEYRDDDDARSIASAPGGSRRKSKDVEKRSSGGLFSSIFKSQGQKEDEKKDDKKDAKKESFLGNAGTLGAGAGLAGVAAAAVASELSRSHAADVSSEPEHEPSSFRQDDEDAYVLDPEVAPRAIKPAIDPQYGDLLPLPPSEPGSPIQDPDELPSLPDSRPDTPPEERNLRRERLTQAHTHQRRRSAQETPVKSPSHTAIPISLRLGQRSSPASPGARKSSPIVSPSHATPESAASARRSGRPTSWDTSREIKPLYLVEHSRQGSADLSAPDADLPPLPPSDPSSQNTSELSFKDANSTLSDDENDSRGFRNEGLGLRISTDLPDVDLAGSQETTPRAEIRPEFPTIPPTVLAQESDQDLSRDIPEDVASVEEPDPVDPMSKDRSSYLLNSTPSSIKSNRTADAESLTQSPPGTTPSKQSGLLLPNIVEDLTSADEHFTDATEGHSEEDAFEDTQDWPLDVTPVAQAPPSADFPSTTAPASDTTASETGEQWSMLSAKQKKKAKRASKNRALQLDDPVETDTRELDTAAGESSQAQDTPVAEPEDSFVEPKKGKKSKKNKRKSISWEPEPEVAPEPTPETELPKDTPEPPKPQLDEPANEAVLDDAAVVSAQDESLPVERELAEVAPEEPEKLDASVPVMDSAAEEPQPEEVTPPEEPQTWETSGKKGKKKKKKSKSVIPWDDEPVAEEPPVQDAQAQEPAPAEELVQDQQNLALGSDARGIEPDTATAGKSDVIVDDFPTAREVDAPEVKSEETPADVNEEVPMPEADPADEWIAPSKLKKDKKKKKKQSMQLDDNWDEPAAAQEEASVVEEPAAVDSIVDPEPSEREAAPPSTEDQASANVETDPVDEWSTTGKSKKDKKKKKKQQSIQFDDAWDAPPEVQQDVPLVEEPAEIGAVAEPELEPSNQDTDQPSLEDQAAANIETEPLDEWAPSTSKKDKKKKKKKQSIQLEDTWTTPSESQDLPPTIEEPREAEALVEREVEDSEQGHPHPSVEDQSSGGNAEAEAEPVEAWIAPATSKKDKKKKKRQSMQMDDSWSMDQETGESSSPPEPQQESREVFTEPEPMTAVVDDQPAAQPEVDPADEWSAPQSKKDKKKKKKKQSLLLDDDWSAPAPAEPESQESEQPTPPQEESESKEIIDEPQMTEPETTEATAPEQELPEADAEAEFAPVTKGKKKKKGKRKSVQWEDEESQPVTEISTLDVAPASDYAMDRSATDKTGEASETFDDWERGVEPSDTQREYDTRDEPAPSTFQDHAEHQDLADDWEQGVEAAETAQDNYSLEQPETSVPQETGDDPLTDDWETAVSPKQSAWNEEGHSDIPARDLESEPSEPLFSQGEPQLETSQDTSKGFEDSHADDESHFDDAGSRAYTQESTEPTDWNEAPTTKKSKKSKKKNRVSFSVPLEESYTEDQAGEITAPQDDDFYSASEPVHVSPAIVTEAEPSQQDGDSEDEWDRLISGNSKRDSLAESSEMEAKDIPESQQEPSNASIIEDAPAVEETKTVEDASTVEEAQVVSEPTTEIVPQQEADVPDEWSQPTGKKGKKKKKRQSATFDNWDDEVAAETPPLAAESAAEKEAEQGSVNPEAEFELPKKGKKNKKKKNQFLLEQDDAAEQTSDQPLDTVPKDQPTSQEEFDTAETTWDSPMEAQVVEPEEAAHAPVESWDEPEAESVPAQHQREAADAEGPSMEDLPAEAAASTDIDSSSAMPQHDPATSEQGPQNVDDDDFFEPVKLSKKDKKKKKKQAALQQSWDEPTPTAVESMEPTVKEADTADAAEANPVPEMVTKDFEEPSTDQQPNVEAYDIQPESKESTNETAAEPAEPTAEDEWAFTVKPSKKDKKKKKKSRDSSFAAFDEPEPEVSREPDIPEPSVGEQVDDSQPVSSAEADEQARPSEVPEDDSFGFGLSKKEKKKRKKQLQQQQQAKLQDFESNEPDEAPVPDTVEEPVAAHTDEFLEESKALEDQKMEDAPQSTDADDWDVGQSYSEIPEQFDSFKSGVVEEAPMGDMPPENLAGDDYNAPEDIIDAWDAVPDEQSKESEEQTQRPTDAQPAELDPPDEAQRTASPVPVAEPSEEAEQWSRPLTKKEKKKKKKSMSMAWDDSSWNDDTTASIQPLAEEQRAEMPDTVEEPAAEANSDSLEGQESLSKDQAEPSAMETQDPAPEADDAWEQPQRKLSKKDKKKQKRRSLLLADEPSAVGESPEDSSRQVTSDEPLNEPQEFSDDLPQAQPVDSWDDPQPADSSYDRHDEEIQDPVPEVEPTAANEDDAWTLPAKKKKGKKGKRLEAFSEAPTTSFDDEPATEAVVPDDPPREDFNVVPEETPIVSEEVTRAAEPVEEEEWALPAKKKGKKGKKSKAGSGTVTPAAVPEDEEPAFTPQEESRDLEPTSTFAAAEEPDSTEAQTAPEPEEEWAMPTKKKGKKSKKSKSGSGTVTPAAAPEDEQPAFVAEAEEESRNIEPTSAFDTYEQPETTEVPAAVEPEDEWAVPSKKKGKKGKKSKAIPLSAFEETTSPALESEAPSAYHERGYPADELGERDDWRGEFGDDTQPVRDEFSTNQGIDRETPLAAQQDTEDIPRMESPTQIADEEARSVDAPAEESFAAPAPTEVVTDDMWSTPARKQSKKEKKRNSKLRAIAEASQSTSTGEETPPAIVVRDTDQESFHVKPQIPDDFAEGFTRTKSKKKRKGLTESSGSSTPRSTGDPWYHGHDEKKDPEVEETRRDDAWDDNDYFATKDSERGNYENTNSPIREEAYGSDRYEKSEKYDLDDERYYDDRARGEERAFEELPEEPAREREETVQPREQGNTSTSREQESRDKSDMDAGQVAAAAGAAAGGVAMLAAKFGGGKKKSKGKKKIVDKRTVREDDIFDDPAVWESAERKPVSDDREERGSNDGFWDDGNDKRDFASAKDTLPTPRSESLTESDGGWKENARQGAQLEDEDAESPVLGRRDAEYSSPAPTPVGLLRRSSQVEEPAGGLLMEDENMSPLAHGDTFYGSEPRWSPQKGLPAVQEMPEVEAAEIHGKHSNWATPDINRDSGFVTDSPNPLRRRSGRFDDDEQQRDSGVHTGDWIEGAGAHMPPTPDMAADKRRLGTRSPFGTPVLREPTAHEVTPEPEKRLRHSAAAMEATPSRDTSNRELHHKKDYGELAAGAAGAAGALSAVAGTNHGRRSVSDNVTGSHRAVSGGVMDGASGPVSGHSGHGQRAETPLRRSASNTSLQRRHTPEPLKIGPESQGIKSTPTPPLRRVDKRMSGDLRALRQQNNSTPPVANEGRVRTKDMTDVYDGYGEGRIGSPRSPTRPHSMRRRQSMQVLELESRVEQLIAENRLLTEARQHAEQNFGQRGASVLSERDAEIDALKQSLQYLQNEVARLTEVNEGLTSANAELANKDSLRYSGVEGAQSRELGGAHDNFSQSLEAKDAEIAELRAQLEAAKEQVRDMQRQILASKSGDAEFLNILDEDYFDNRCQQLCSHVQQWVLRFSKFSDMRACRLTSEINDEKTIDRLDNAVLDGSDVDIYLNDRVRRRDIFMSMTMNMIWEFVFTRYLFGMDREQRQKLKSLEKLLTEVGPPQAVRQWRAVTLTLLSRRDTFQQQRDIDTEAVVQAVFQTLCKILPPPGNLEDQIQSQLRRVMREAVDLSIEMRMQKAEYMMLPPLQPEYDSEGELAATVQFNASMMHERSGKDGESNEDLEAQGAIVRVVLFPLVVKRGDDNGDGDDEIVVCPAQVLIARDKGKRHVTPSSDAGGASLGAQSQISLATEFMGRPEAEYMEGGI